MSDHHEIARLTLEVALAELAQGAGEEGGNNRGPWVAKYMGVEGQPWCVGFATWCHRQACQQLGLDPALAERWSSSRLAAEAARLGLLFEPTQLRLPEPESMQAAQGGAAELRPGHFFIVRGGPTGFAHTGLVREPQYDAAGRLAAITTVEGNVRPEGGGRRDRVLSRRRSASALVFVAY